MHLQKNGNIWGIFCSNSWALTRPVTTSTSGGKAHSSRHSLQPKLKFKDHIHLSLFADRTDFLSFALSPGLCRPSRMLGHDSTSRTWKVNDQQWCLEAGDPRASHPSPATANCHLCSSLGGLRWAGEARPAKTMPEGERKKRPNF